MQDLVFYNQYGKATCYLSNKDDETIYLFSGKAVAYLYNNSVYSFRGKHLGFYENGWIYDNNGYCVFYTERATGGPVKPVRGITPVKGVASVKPIKHAKSIT